MISSSSQSLPLFCQAGYELFLNSSKDCISILLKLILLVVHLYPQALTFLRVQKVPGSLTQTGPKLILFSLTIEIPKTSVLIFRLSVQLLSPLALLQQLVFILRENLAVYQAQLSTPHLGTSPQLLKSQILSLQPYEPVENSAHFSFPRSGLLPEYNPDFHSIAPNPESSKQVHNVIVFPSSFLHRVLSLLVLLVSVACRCL